MWHVHSYRLNNAENGKVKLQKALQVKHDWVFFAEFFIILCDQKRATVLVYSITNHLDY